MLSYRFFSPSYFNTFEEAIEHARKKSTQMKITVKVYSLKIDNRLSERNKILAALRCDFRVKFLCKVREGVIL